MSKHFEYPDQADETDQRPTRRDMNLNYFTKHKPLKMVQRRSKEGLHIDATVFHAYSARIEAVYGLNTQICSFETGAEF